MKLIIYSLNYSPELTGIGKYNGELAEELNKLGMEIHVVTAPPYYPEWKRFSGFRNWWNKSFSGGVTVYRCPLYVPSKVTNFKRLIHLLSFALTSSFRLLSLLRLKPEVMFLVQPTLFCAPMALLYAKLVGAKAVLHIQDFEVDALFGLRESKRDGEGGFLKRVVCHAESYLMRRFDLVSSISFSMLANAERKSISKDKLCFFPNWSDTGFVTPDSNGAEIRRRWGYSETDRVVVYSGNIGQKQGLEIVLDAAEAISDRSEVKFVVIGSGAYGETLRSSAAQRCLSNIDFKSLQAWEDVPKILAMADVHLVVQKRGAADAVLPSKLTNILSAGGHALVTADPHTELGRMADHHPGLYEVVEPEDATAFVEGLERCLAKDTTKPNMVARQYALDFLNKEKVINRFVKDLRALTELEDVQEEAYEL